MTSHRASVILTQGRRDAEKKNMNPLRLSGSALESLAVVLWLAAAAHAGVVDRVAVVVGDHVITESQVLDQLRLSEFENGKPLALGPEERRAAAEQLVDQELIRNEMQIGGYELPPESAAGGMLDKFRREHYPDAAAFRDALAKYGLTENQLKEYFRWQLAVIRFTDVRFQPTVPVQGPGGANRMSPGAAASDGNNVDEMLDAWLKQARAATRIRFVPEAFQ
jgi:hypothetical protein